MKTRIETLAKRAITEAKKYRDIVNAQDELISLREDDIRFLVDIIKSQDQIIERYKQGLEILPSEIDSIIEKFGPLAENRKKALLKRQDKAEKKYKKFKFIIEKYKIDIVNLKRASLESNFNKYGLKLKEGSLYNYQKRYKEEKKLFS
jgi:hypothetical protein